MTADVAPLTFSVLGLLLGAWRCIGARSFVPQGLTYGRRDWSRAYHYQQSESALAAWLKPRSRRKTRRGPEASHPRTGVAPTALARQLCLTQMATKYILAMLGVAFLVAATLRLVRDGGKVGPATRTWLLAGGIFVIVAGWLWFQD